MRIYRMIATFGKLEHAELTLEPGLNVIYAPNEWGKSTWCAFLLAMLYGLDTRAKSRKSFVADKERYVPWSGSPMSGRIDLNWQGRDITIERTTHGRIPLGIFNAYETGTGLRIRELTGANCGQMLLGVEQSVYRRSGFIRLADLPVEQDEALLRRLNALVTTGDDSGEGDRLAEQLKDLKNRCRYHKTGLIPQQEQENRELEEKLEEIRTLKRQGEMLEQRRDRGREQLEQLRNHREHLACRAAQSDADKVARARAERDRTEQEADRLDHVCSRLPSREETREKIAKLRQFQSQWAAAMMEQELLPKVSLPPEAPRPFQGMSVEDGEAMVNSDRTRLEALRRQNNLLPLILGSAAWVGGIVLVLMSQYLAAALAAGAGLGALLWMILREKDRKKKIALLMGKYNAMKPDRWMEPLEHYRRELQEYKESRRLLTGLRGDLDSRLEKLQQQRESLCSGEKPEKVAEIWQEVLSRWDSLEAARRDAARAGEYYEAVRAMAKPVKTPDTEDSLTWSEEETLRLLADGEAELQKIGSALAQYQGRTEALGDPRALELRLDQGKKRLQKLEDTYAALSMAQEALAEASAQLQREFAPRISRRAQEFMSRMTAGRYDRLQLDEEFRLQTGAEQEDVLHEALWRSDGTMDQLYIALRLAVSEALTPDAPLVLDDALVRFDDRRLQAALELFREQKKQVILCTCQKREGELLKITQ